MYVTFCASPCNINSMQSRKKATSLQCRGAPCRIRSSDRPGTRSTFSERLNLWLRTKATTQCSSLCRSPPRGCKGPTFHIALLRLTELFQWFFLSTSIGGRWLCFFKWVWHSTFSRQICPQRNSICGFLHYIILAKALSRKEHPKEITDWTTDSVYCGQVGERDREALIGIDQSLLNCGLK